MKSEEEFPNRFDVGAFLNLATFAVPELPSAQGSFLSGRDFVQELKL